MVDQPLTHDIQVVLQDERDTPISVLNKSSRVLCMLDMKLERTVIDSATKYVITVIVGPNPPVGVEVEATK